MRMRLLVALVAGLMVGSDPAPDLGEVTQLQVIPPGSRWVRRGSDGRAYVEVFTKDGRWLTCLDPARLMTAKYTLNMTASQPHIETTTEDGKPRHGIYRMEGDRLFICLSTPDGPTRPSTFAHRPEAGQYLFILKRLK
jgi:uncharacterized protein (TIGR03067 family)